MTTKINPPTVQEYQKAQLQTALNYAPTIYPCKKCEWPVAEGYCCRYCGDDNPSSKD